MSIGAQVTSDGTRFEVWAPEAQSIEVISPEKKETAFLLQKSADGKWIGVLPQFKAGDLYFYRINGDQTFPDPASRYQPQGVHGPSQIMPSNSFQWSDSNWPGIQMEQLILYELHTGTFSPEGTFEGIVKRLPYLSDLGITAVELMPVADFPGNRNWGYDGVSLFAPARCYGTPDDLRKLVNAAHQQGLAVVMDVVYNHFGPDGAYQGAFSPFYFTSKHKTPWGDAINLDGKNNRAVRDYFIENALYWLTEFHIDGLRLDATHALIDESPQHFLAELTSRVNSSEIGRDVVLIAEDHRNLAKMIHPHDKGGWNLDGVWSDDFHHILRRLLAGDSEGYYSDFKGTVDELVTAIQKGWLFTGQFSSYMEENRGTDPTGIPSKRFVVFIQNHDQVGNRAFGERLHHQIDPAAFRAASTLLLCIPQTPLLFMGQEWGATSPFCYFTDHNEELGRLVTEGRRKEFARFSEFTKPESRNKIPDPQDISTFESSKLKWNEQELKQHQCSLNLYRSLTRIRKTEPALCSGRHEAFSSDDRGLVLMRSTHHGPSVLIAIQLVDSGEIEIPYQADNSWKTILTTEEEQFCEDPAPPDVISNETVIQIRFRRPGAVILKNE